MSPAELLVTTIFHPKMLFVTRPAVSNGLPIEYQRPMRNQRGREQPLQRVAGRDSLLSEDYVDWRIDLGRIILKE